MRSLVGNPKAGLAALGVYTVLFVIIDGLNSSAETGGPAPAALIATLNIAMGLMLPVIVLAQRAADLPRAWRTANTIALIDAVLLLLFSIGHWVDILARPDDYWRPAVAPGSIGLLIVLATALVQPGDPYRWVREGLIAAGCVFIVCFAGLLITTHFSETPQRSVWPGTVILGVLVSGVTALIAYEFGSRLRRAGPEPGP